MDNFRSSMHQSKLNRTVIATRGFVRTYTLNSKLRERPIKGNTVHCKLRYASYWPINIDEILQGCGEEKEIARTAI